MNKELELESNDVYTSRIELHPQSKMYSIEQLALCEKQSFIAGATSKYVEKQKLEFAKNQLEKFRSKLGGYDFLSAIFKRKLEIQIQELEQKLSEL